MNLGTTRGNPPPLINLWVRHRENGSTTIAFVRSLSRNGQSLWLVPGSGKDYLLALGLAEQLTLATVEEATQWMHDRLAYLWKTRSEGSAEVALGAVMGAVFGFTVDQALGIPVAFSLIFGAVGALAGLWRSQSNRERLRHEILGELADVYAPAMRSHGIALQVPAMADWHPNADRSHWRPAADQSGSGTDIQVHHGPSL